MPSLVCRTWQQFRNSGVCQPCACWAIVAAVLTAVGLIKQLHGKHPHYVTSRCTLRTDNSSDTVTRVDRLLNPSTRQFTFSPAWSACHTKRPSTLLTSASMLWDFSGLAAVLLGSKIQFRSVSKALPAKRCLPPARHLSPSVSRECFA